MEQNKVFISHANSDYRDAYGKVIPGNAISEIIKVLDDNHIDRWIDESGLLSSKGWCQQIENAINECNIFLYVSSEKANVSPNTANEIAYAIEHKKHIIPFKLDKSDYHKDMRLNLIRIHFLKYYEDREKALRDLVTTIKDIRTDVVIINTSVKLSKISKDYMIGEELLSTRVLSIFNSSGISSSVQSFLYLINALNCKSEEGFEILEKYILRLQKISNERNHNVRFSRIEKLISDIKEDNTEFERLNSIFVVLLKMYLYFCLGDISEVVLIQKELSDVKFELTYKERNADTINDITNAIVRGGTFIASAAALLMGKGGSIARGSMMASTKGDKITLVKTPQEINARIETFESLKTVASGLLFFEA